jgi:hypothetical protein
MRVWLDGAPLIDAATPGRPDRFDLGGGDAPRKIAAAELAAGRGYPIRVEYVRAPPSRAEQATTRSRSWPGNTSASASASRAAGSPRPRRWRRPATRRWW